MKPVSALLFATGAAAAVLKRNVDVNEPLAARTIDSWILNNNEPQRDYWYGRAALYTGVEAVYELTKNETLLAWYRSRIDGLVVTENGTIPGFRTDHYSLDDYRIGRNILYWYQRTGEEKYKIAASTIRGMLNNHPRTATGGFWHRSPIYKNQMWLDGIYMADTFYAHYTSLFDAANTTAWDDIVLQWDKIEEAIRDPVTGLLFHGFDEGKEAVWADDVTGASPLIWNRAVGWYFMSLIEVLDLFPKEHAGYERLLGYYTSLAAALKRAQDPTSNGWWLVMNEPYPGKEGNYFESSSAAMFTWGWLAGLRLGYIDEATYLEPATKAYTHLVTDFITKNCNGTVTWTDTVQVGSLNSDASFEYYVGIPVVDNDTRGVGPYLLAAYEWELRNNISA
ncbi:cell wall glycosyl hydrolase [Colletotrichum tabaci]|uniref:Cell wall glycosyl hydrolase n=1 Tax=Colletotrichum tabaci TaxID=1209068 RepID=A0AAV9TR21_9PEZI